VPVLKRKGHLAVVLGWWAETDSRKTFEAFELVSQVNKISAFSLKPRAWELVMVTGLRLQPVG